MPSPTEIPAPLREWLEIESVSSDPERAAEVERAAEWVIDQMAPAGGRWELRRPAGAVHPVVVGRLAASSRPAPHVLLYGHFDVVPAHFDDGWQTPPFSPTIVDGWVHARGAADSKSNAYVLLAAARALAREGRLPVDLTIVCDGEEEIDGVAAAECIDAAPDLDGAIVCDGGMRRPGLPTFCISTRGQISYRVSVCTGREELHSGRFGGVALNAVQALIAALAAATAVPGELGAGLPPEPEDLDTWNGLEPGDEVLAAAGAVPADPDAGRELYPRTELGTALDVNGIEGGEPGQQKSIVPVRAHAYLSLRVPPGHDLEAADSALRRALGGGTPPGAELSLRRLGSVSAASVERRSAAVSCAGRAMRKVFGVEPLLVRSGASIGVMGALAARRVPTVMTGFALPDSRVHAANERFPLDHLPLGIEAITEMLTAFAELPEAMSDGGGRAPIVGWEGRYFEDFEVGDTYRHPLGRTVTTTDNSWLTLLTQNTAPLHFDANYASQTSWRRPLVNSTFTLALVTGQSVTDISQHVFANLGWDEVRLPAPVFEGDTIYSRSTVLEKRESGSRADVGIVRVRTEGLNQDGIVVITFLRTMMVFKRGHGPATGAGVAEPTAVPPTTARSWLFVPADRPDRFDKAAASAADAVILDLEDGVAPAAKGAARQQVAEWLRGGGRAWVRVGQAGGEEWRADLEALRAAAGPDLAGLVLPKSEHRGDVAATLARLSVPVVALIETAVGIENAAEVAAVPGVAALALGSVDLGLELGLGANPAAWAYPRGRLVVASRAAGLRAPIDGPTMQLDDPAITAADAELARELGFGAKLCVHPRQAAAVNEAFAHSAEEVGWARRVVAAAAEADGGAVRVGDEMIDRPRLAQARAILADAEHQRPEPGPGPGG